MPRITEERREARREQILEAARSCLQEHGLEAVSMEMIIARSGLSTGAVYGYFKGKDGTIMEFGMDKQDGIDRLQISLHGWSHSQSDPELRERTRAAYRRQRELFADVVRRWQAAGTLGPGADPDSIAELMQTVILGFVAQRALAGDADVQAHAAALEALASASCTSQVSAVGARAAPE
jgi:AcrR family transcriptional regulator